ncbi:hypothetical protein QL285_038768 [Trifolium repens]|nr:hypothetical protein QL285_038768 [Trifolium repens]
MYISNPAIRKIGKLKFSVDPEDEKRSLISRQYDFNLTFGFHPHKKEYVLFAVRVAAGRNPDPHKEIFVFYLGNDRCDKLGDLPYDGQVMMRNGILAKENVYRCIKSGDIYYVVSYGLVLKEYSQITLPFDLADFQFLGQLYKLKDSLAVFSRHRQPEYTDFWLLDANNKDWTPLCRIELAVIYSPVYMYDNVLLAHIRSSGGNGYLVYNVESNLQLKFSLAEHIDSDGFFKSPVKVYHESLVWPLYSKVVKAIYKAESSLEGNKISLRMLLLCLLKVLKLVSMLKLTYIY